MNTLPRRSILAGRREGRTPSGLLRSRRLTPHATAINAASTRLTGYMPPLTALPKITTSGRSPLAPR